MKLQWSAVPLSAAPAPDHGEWELQPTACLGLLRLGKPRSLPVARTDRLGGRRSAAEADPAPRPGPWPSLEAAISCWGSASSPPSGWRPR